MCEGVCVVVVAKEVGPKPHRLRRSPLACSPLLPLLPLLLLLLLLLPLLPLFLLRVPPFQRSKLAKE